MARKPKTADRRIRTNVYLDAEQKAALERLTDATRVPWAEYVREGIDMVLKKYQKLIKTGKPK